MPLVVVNYLPLTSSCFQLFNVVKVGFVSCICNFALSVTFQWVAGYLASVTGYLASSSHSHSLLVSSRTSQESIPLLSIRLTGSTRCSLMQPSIRLLRLLTVPTSMVSTWKAAGGIRNKVALKSLSLRFSTPRCHSSGLSQPRGMRLLRNTHTQPQSTRPWLVSVFSPLLVTRLTSSA